MAQRYVIAFPNLYQALGWPATVTVTANSEDEAILKAEKKAQKIATATQRSVAESERKLKGYRNICPTCGEPALGAHHHETGEE